MTHSLLLLPGALLLGGLLLGACQQRADAGAADANNVVWKSDAFTLYRDSVVQGDNHARALSATELVSNYRSPANERLSPLVTFKFSLNGKDNELPSGQDNTFLALSTSDDETLETPVIVWGQRVQETRPVPTDKFLAPNTKVKFRLDLRPVLEAFAQQGYYTTFKGEKLYKQDFKGVFVAGTPAPLSWDFDNLHNKPELELHDSDGDGIYEGTLTLNVPQAAPATAPRWKQSLKTADLPQYKSEYPLADALYNLALEEARRAVEPDSTFRTGKEWAGVWTRDISYSIILAQATLQPRVGMKSLLRKVSSEGRIIQDTGTGGAYPCSTDRVIWAVAAWEIYKVTGDKAWLKKVYPIVLKSLQDDAQNVYDATTGLARGESSFLDWREQTYPRWMQPVDIYESENLGTNAVHFQANTVLAQMAEQLGHADVAAQHQQVAATIKAAINKHLWQPGPGYYGQYRYGRLYPTLSPRAEALGEALSVWFGVADAEQARTVVSKTPTVAFGIPCIYPQIPGIPPYHNDAVWPFVQSYWALAAAQAGNEASLTASMAAVYRPAALFLTNKENFVAGSGDFAGTQINSSNMLWSLSGSLGLVYRILFGMHYETDRLVFKPFVPQAFAGRRSLTGFKYRRAVLDVEVQGFGNEIKTITLDGQPLAGAAVPASLVGHHQVHIELASKSPGGNARRVPNLFTPETPQVSYANGRLSWSAQTGVQEYRILKNGVVEATGPATEHAVAAPTDVVAEYQVLAVGGDGLQSFASEPLDVGPAPQLVQLEALAPAAMYPYKGYTGQGFIEVGTAKNTHLSIPLQVPTAGLYALDFRYANGNGPINTNNKCAIRTLRDAAGRQLGTVVLPQRGVDEWSNWGYSNAVLVQLPAGASTLTLSYEPADTNMNGAVNQAMLDHLRLRRLQ